MAGTEQEWSALRVFWERYYRKAHAILKDILHFETRRFLEAQRQLI
jgi:hypothetical protein